MLHQSKGGRWQELTTLSFGVSVKVKSEVVLEAVLVGNQVLPDHGVGARVARAMSASD